MTTLAYYAESPLWVGTIQEAKNRYDLHIAVKDGFPDTQFDKHEAEGILSQVIAERNATSDTCEYYLSVLSTETDADTIQDLHSMQKWSK